MIQRSTFVDLSHGDLIAFELDCEP